MEDVLLIGAGLADDAAIAHVLERDGWSRTLASDYADGLAAVRQHHPAVVVIEERPGEDDGVALLKQIRAEEPASEVVLVTDGGEVDVAIEVLRAGALDYLRRPVDAEQFRVALGRARERRPHRRAPEPAVVLVIEDHEPTLRQLVRVLEKEGFRVHAAGDGEAGLRAFAENRIDLILVDLSMPKKDGLTVLRETKGKGADVEVIVVTGYGNENVVVEALRQGAVNFLRKPVDIEQMLLAIQKALEFQTVRRSLAYRNRDIELMQELVVRLTRELELVVEAPHALSSRAVDFLHQLVDALPLGIVVADSTRRVLFVNRHVADKLGSVPDTLSATWLREVGVTRVSEEDLTAAFNRTIDHRPGSVETLMISKWAFLVMTPLRLIRPDGTERFVAVAIRGERQAPTTSDAPPGG